MTRARAGALATAFAALVAAGCVFKVERTEVLFPARFALVPQRQRVRIGVEDSLTIGLIERSRALLPVALGDRAAWSLRLVDEEVHIEDVSVCWWRTLPVCLLGLPVGRLFFYSEYRGSVSLVYLLEPAPPGSGPARWYCVSAGFDYIDPAWVEEDRAIPPLRTLIRIAHREAAIRMVPELLADLGLARREEVRLLTEEEVQDMAEKLEREGPR